MPTMQVLEGMRLMYDPEFLDDPALAAVIPAELIDWYRSDEGRWFAEELRADFGGVDDERIQAIYERGGGGRAASQMTVKYLAERDARFLFGTDTPSGPTYGNPPGYNGAMEMKLLVEAGVSLRQLLIAATIANAEAFHLDDRYGTIQAGKIANLLLLDQNPLESVDAWNTIRAVVLHGEWIDRASLSAAP
jgi:imidazolonepropionase-like amidohydrolase